MNKYTPQHPALSTQHLYTPSTQHSYALQLDKADPLKKFRSRFFLPEINGKEVIYFTGNSLGLQPKSTPKYIQQELKDWARLAVEGHFAAANPWVSYHRILTPSAARIVGAKESEVVMMNSLTVNLHLLMVSFYRPDKKRYKIITEAGAFSSDMYALESQVKAHGLDPDKAIVEVGPREGEATIRDEDIIKAIEKHAKNLCLVLIGGANYYTGQVFDMKKITEAAHKAGAYVGFDLAHAAGNVELKLNQWKTDFAVWCTYKYLNSGPGGVGGAFVHEKHSNRPDLERFAGWWGHNEKERFRMEKGFKPMKGAEGWQLSNAPVLSMAAHKASLDIFEEAGMENLLKKSRQMTSYQEFLIKELCRNRKAKYSISIITPEAEKERGCQLSIRVKKNGRELFEQLVKDGFMVDWRSPDVVRAAPVPLYNKYEEVFLFATKLAEYCRYE